MIYPLHMKHLIYIGRILFLWAWLFLIGVGGATYSCLETWDRYLEASTITVIDTTRYPYSNVPFPSVSVCDKSRVDWSRALALQEKDLPSPYNVTKEKTLVLLKRLAYTTFGDFDFMDQIRLEHINLTEISSVNISEILLKVMRPCHEMFLDFCWFRDKEYNCCKIFELQKTELGFCYSFNSDTSEESKHLSYGWAASGSYYWIDSNGEVRPRRTAQHGPWSGLRFTVSVLPESNLPPDGNQTTTGISVIVSNPKSFPFNGYDDVGAGMFGVFSVWGDALIARDRVRNMKPEIRKCLYPDENIYHLPQGYYTAENCRVACFQEYVLKYCNCSPDFMFPLKNGKNETLPPCNAEGLICLSEYNDIFTYEVPDISSIFFKSSRTGMKCNCLADCTSQQYITELISPMNLNISTSTMIDVHYRVPFCTLFRTDIVNDWLDMIVSFGGIAGLFLGASLMSSVELIYFFTIRLFYIWNERRKKLKPPIKPYIN